MSISLKPIGYDAGYTAIATAGIPELQFGASTDGSQCFRFHTYAEDGTHRRENITDWALDQFRSHYADPSITKWDIFHYVYAILHHPDYRQRYAANLRRELPRIPFVGAGTDRVGADATVRPAERSSASAAMVNDESRLSANPSPVGAAYVSPGRKSGVDEKRKPTPLCRRPLPQSEARRQQGTPRSHAKRNSQMKKNTLSCQR